MHFILLNMNCNNTLFIPKQHAHKESDSPGALSSLPIDIIIQMILSVLIVHYLPLYIRWRHPFYVNTCIHIRQLFFNNHATLLLTHAPLYCQQNQDFLNKLNVSPVECSYIKSLKVGSYYIYVTWKHNQTMSKKKPQYWTNQFVTKLQSNRKRTELLWLRIQLFLLLLEQRAGVGVYMSRLNYYSYSWFQAETPAPSPTPVAGIGGVQVLS